MKDECFLLPRGSGGNVLFNDEIIVRRTAGIGDALAATVVSDRLIQMGFDVHFQAAIGIHCVLRRHPKLMRVSAPNGHCDINLDNTYETNPRRHRLHFHEMFFDAANDQLRKRDMHLGKPFNCRPVLKVADNEHAAALAKFKPYPKPWIFICPRSESFACRQVPDGIWMAAAEHFEGTAFWLGLHPAPPGIVDLQVRHLDNLITWLSAADLMVSVDTGPMHIAAALGIPIVAINQSSSPDLHLSDQCDFTTIEPNLDCLNCQKNICPINAHIPPCQNINPDLIAATVDSRMLSPGVTAIISIYKPEAQTLNECLTRALPQVDEVIIVRDQAGVLPDNVINHQKIRHLVKAAKDIGYGRKINYAARHATNHFLLFLNDDCFLHDGCVAALAGSMHPGVGMVAPLLRYPTGLIYHAGKIRGKGQRGWGHIDHNRYDPTFEQETELENCCGACVMVRRKAFYDAGCFDEDFYLYAEDDALALQVRRAGYKILFNPKAQGIHLEHQSTKKTPYIVDIMHASNRLFTEKWGAYLDWNSERVPLGNFDYLKTNA